MPLDHRRCQLQLRSQLFGKPFPWKLCDVTKSTRSTQTLHSCEQVSLVLMKRLNDVSEVPQIHLGRVPPARSSKNHLGICKYEINSCSASLVILASKFRSKSRMPQRWAKRQTGKVGALRPGANIKTEANAKLFQGLVHYVLPR